MAAFGVYKRKGSPFYWVWYGSGAGRKMESSRKRKDDPLGWKQAYDYARMKGGGGGGKTSTKSAHWDAWVEDWIDTILPVANHSKQTALIGWRFLRAYLGSVDALEPADVTYGTAMGYFAWRKNNRRQKDRPKIHTARREVVMLKRIMEEARKRGFVATNPLLELKLPAHKPKEKPEISAEEEAIIRKHLAGKEGHLPITERWMTISFLFGIRQGWRIAETSFPLSRVNWETWEVLVHSKGDRWRTVPVHPELRPILLELRAAGAKLSCVFPRNSPMAASVAWSLMLRGVERDNIKGLLPHLCHHCCRVTAVSRLARAGVPERLVMEFVGHWSITSHRIYSRVAHGDLARCILPDAPSSGSPQSPAPEIAANA